MSLSVGLVHYPILDKTKNVICTNITNLDIHDIARACRTYGVSSYYLIHPHEEQLMFVHRVLDHWRTGFGSKYNPKRKEALKIIKTANSIASACKDIGEKVEVIATSANRESKLDEIKISKFREALKNTEGVREKKMLLFGTGYGLSSEALEACHFRLEPLMGNAKDQYRHLSVRSAVSIYLDRLLG